MALNLDQKYIKVVKGGTTYNLTAINVVKGGVTYNVWGASSAVTYVVDGSTAYSEDVTRGNSVLSPTTFTPSKSGYTFVGWRENNTASNSVLTSKTMGDSPITLYAVFKRDLTLTYYDNSTTSAKKTGTQYYNNGNTSNPSWTMTQASKSGWDVRGWSTSNTADASISYNDKASVSISSNTTIYGCYSQTITLTYYNNSTTAKTSTGTRYYNSGGNTKNPTFTLSQADKSGWTKRGWSTGTGGNASVTYSSISSTAFSSNTTVYGLYYKTCTLTAISYNKSEPVSGTAYYNSSGDTYNVSWTAPTGASYSGWTWRGWATGTGASTSIAYANGATIWNGTSDLTIYGCYQQTITLSYNGNGATSGSVSSQTGTRYWNAAGNTSNPSFTLASNGYSKTDYTFQKWAQGSASGTQYAAGTSVTLSANTTFYAVWIASPFYWWQRTSSGVQYANGYPTSWSVVDRGCDGDGLAWTNQPMADNTLYCDDDCGGYIHLRATASSKGCKKARIYVAQTHKTVLKANGTTLYNFETQGNGNEYYGAGTYDVNVNGGNLTLDLTIHGHGCYCYINYVYFYN